MKTASHVLSILALTLLTSLLASSPVDAGDLIGDSFVIRAEPEQEVHPALAYNSQWQEYLVVFWNDRPGNDDIRAERVSRNGALLGGRWIAAGSGAERRHPDVAYNPQRNDYLIVWAEEVGAYSFIRTQRFTADLQPLPEGVQTLVAGVIGVYTSANPAVAYAFTDDKYLVVWEVEVNTPLAPPASSIAGHLVNGDGVKDGGSFNISLDSGGAPRRNPDVAYNRSANRHLVVWQQAAGALWDIHGQQVYGSGGLHQGDITIAYYVVSSMAPAVAAIPTTPTNDKFVVVWELQYAPNDRDIQGRPVQEDGTPGAVFWVAWESGIDESSPAIAGSEESLRYFVAWRRPQGVMNQPIRGRAITYTGAPVEQEVEFSGVAAESPAVVGGPTGDFLATWQDQPLSATNTNIYGQLWGNRLHLPLLLRG